MPKVVYIFSLGHSGSTLLDLLLSGPAVAAAYLLYPGIQRIYKNDSYPPARNNTYELSFRPPVVEQG